MILIQVSREPSVSYEKHLLTPKTATYLIDYFTYAYNLFCRVDP